MGTPKKRLLIDTDAGIDDAQAIFMALSDPNVEIVAITTVHGNTDNKQVAKNVLRLLKVAGRLEIPVFMGCDVSLIGQNIQATHYHGLDGFGDVPDPDAPGLECAQKEHAVNAIIRIVNESPGEISLVCLAPLTNISLALRLDPNLGKQLKDCYIMGGNYEGKGNISPSAEFNFYSDPEAAEIVLRELGCHITLVCWELCLKHSFSWETYDMLRNSPTSTSKFLKILEKFTMEKCRKLAWTCYIPCDELCMAVVLNSSLASVVQDYFVEVETCHGKTRGQMVVHSDRWLMGEQTKINASIVKEIDQEAYLDLLKM